MKRRNDDRKDQLIAQQLDVIRTMTENNLSHMGGDFWGTPAAPSPETGRSGRAGRWRSRSSVWPGA